MELRDKLRRADRREPQSSLISTILEQRKKTWKTILKQTATFHRKTNSFYECSRKIRIIRYHDCDRSRKSSRAARYLRYLPESLSRWLKHRLEIIASPRICSSLIARSTGTGQRPRDTVSICVIPEVPQPSIFSATKQRNNFVTDRPETPRRINESNATCI